MTQSLSQKATLSSVEHVNQHISKSKKSDWIMLVFTCKSSQTKIRQVAVNVVMKWQNSKSFEILNSMKVSNTCVWSVGYCCLRFASILTPLERSALWSANGFTISFLDNLDHFLYSSLKFRKVRKY